MQALQPQADSTKSFYKRGFRLFILESHLQKALRLLGWKQGYVGLWPTKNHFRCHPRCISRASGISYRKHRYTRAPVPFCLLLCLLRSPTYRIMSLWPVIKKSIDFQTETMMWNFSFKNWNIMSVVRNVLTCIGVWYWLKYFDFAFEYLF